MRWGVASPAEEVIRAEGLDLRPALAHIHQEASAGSRCAEELAPGEEGAVGVAGVEGRLNPGGRYRWGGTGLLRPPAGGGGRGGRGARPGQPAPGVERDPPRRGAAKHAVLQRGGVAAQAGPRWAGQAAGVAHDAYKVVEARGVGRVGLGYSAADAAVLVHAGPETAPPPVVQVRGVEARLVGVGEGRHRRRRPPCLSHGHCGPARE
mmetsp:Transcript_25795/g.81553  ORF Transcript_25795/g.81553 Transcript_25795/m.81553 type:complete len:207 (+) Transcript_25795:2585-3205(+)